MSSQTSASLRRPHGTTKTSEETSLVVNDPATMSVTNHRFRRHRAHRCAHRARRCSCFRPPQSHISRNAPAQLSVHQATASFALPFGASNATVVLEARRIRVCQKTAFGVRAPMRRREKALVRQSIQHDFHHSQLRCIRPSRSGPSRSLRSRGAAAGGAAACVALWLVRPSLAQPVVPCLRRPWSRSGIRQLCMLLGQPT